MLDTETREGLLRWLDDLILMLQYANTYRVRAVVESACERLCEAMPEGYVARLIVANVRIWVPRRVGPAEQARLLDALRDMRGRIARERRIWGLPHD
jgi:hypothetical protein